MYSYHADQIALQTPQPVYLRYEFLIPVMLVLAQKRLLKRLVLLLMLLLTQLLLQGSLLEWLLVLSWVWLLELRE